MFFNDDNNSGWDYNKDFDYFSDNNDYPLYEVDRDDTCYNNYNDDTYDYSSNNYWD